MKPFAVLLPRNEQNAADGFDRAAFAADDAAIVVRRDANGDLHILPVGMFGHLYRIGIADERFHDLFNGSLHSVTERPTSQTV